MRKKAVARPGEDVLVSTYLTPELHESLKLIVAGRKASPTRDKPRSLKTALEDAIFKVIALLKSGNPVAFVPLPPTNTKQTSYRISASAYKAATHAAASADVRLADFLRTAIWLYSKVHAVEIYEEARSPVQRRRAAEGRARA